MILPSTHNRRLGGLTAKRSGEVAENEFDISAADYARFGLIDSRPTYAEFVVTERITKGKNKGMCIGYFKQKGTSDRVLSIAELGGRLCWMEIKHVKGNNRKAIQNTAHQYRQMFEAQRDGNALAFYILRWNHNDNIEWRLYPLDVLNADYNAPNDQAIVFEREAGLLVGGTDTPDWLPVVTEYARLTV